MMMTSLFKRLKKLENLAPDFISGAKNKLKIRTGELEREFSEHSEIYADVGTFFSETVELCELSKLYLKIARSKVELYIRKNPAKYIEGSKTEKSIAAAIEIDTRIIKAEKLRIRVLGLQKRVEAVKDAYDHRRSMLNNIQELILAGLINPMARVSDVEFNESMKKVKHDKKKKKNKRIHGRR